MSGDVTVAVPGIVDRTVRDGSWRTDSPRAYALYDAGTLTRTGKGHRWTFTLPVADAEGLLTYLVGVRDVVAGMTAEERGEGGGAELRALRAACDRLTQALRGAGQ